VSKLQANARESPDAFVASGCDSPAANSSVALEPRVQRGEVLTPLPAAAALVDLKAPMSIFCGRAPRPSIHPGQVRECLAVASVDVGEADVLHFMAERAEREKSIECLDPR
jgi:hypothetical protein